jgi:hypothetical protein
MNNITEESAAETLVTTATDLVTLYYDPEDWDAGIVAVLARALELSTGRELKPLEQLWTTTIST